MSRFLRPGQLCQRAGLGTFPLHQSRGTGDREAGLVGLLVAVVCLGGVCPRQSCRASIYEETVDYSAVFVLFLFVFNYRLQSGLCPCHSCRTRREKGVGGTVDIIVLFFVWCF